jgi:hypothetical protein
MPLLAIVVLAAITYAFRIVGPLCRDRITLPPAATLLFADAAAVLLIALAATSALMNGHDFAGWARPAVPRRRARRCLRHRPAPPGRRRVTAPSAGYRDGLWNLSMASRTGPNPVATCVASVPSAACVPRWRPGRRHDHAPTRRIRGRYAA